jgi:hypothetical protein
MDLDFTSKRDPWLGFWWDIFVYDLFLWFSTLSSFTYFTLGSRRLKEKSSFINLLSRATFLFRESQKFLLTQHNKLVSNASRHQRDQQGSLCWVSHLKIAGELFFCSPNLIRS